MIDDGLFDACQCIRSPLITLRAALDAGNQVLNSGEPLLDEIDALLARMEQQLSASPIPEFKDGEVSASIGKARFPYDGSTVEALLVAADRAMYEIKEKRHAASRSKDVSGEVMASGGLKSGRLTLQSPTDP